MLDNLTKEEIGILILVLALFNVWLNKLETKVNKPKKKAAVKVPLTLESLEKRVIALEKKPKGKS